MRRPRHAALSPSVFFPLALALAATPASATRLVLVHTNDVHGHALPYGDDDDVAGLARMATLVSQAKAAEPNTLFLNAGDTFEGTLFFNAGEGEFDFALMQLMGLDALAVGNHDFALGTAKLDTAFTAAGATYPYLACNVNLTGVSTALDPIIIGNYTNGVPDAQQYVVKVMPNGVRVGLVGVVTSETASIQPESTNDGVVFYDPTSTPTIYQVLQGVVTAMRTTGNCDIVVLVSHEGLTNSSSSIEDDTKIANNVTGIDVIIGGHDHVARPTVTTIGGTTLVYAGAFSRYLGMLDLDVNTTTNTTTVTSYGLQEINRTITPDPTVQAAIDGYKAQVDAKYPGAYTDVVARNRTFMSGSVNAETGLGNLVTDAYRTATGSDFAIDLTGSLRFDAFRGNLYPAEIFNVLSLDYDPALGHTIPLKTVPVFGISNGPLASGQPLVKALLELLVSDFLKANFPSAGAPQLGGMTFEYDMSAGDFSRVSNIMINGQPFNPSATYVMSTSENVAQQAAAIDALFGLTGQPNSFVTNLTTTTIEPWVALRDRFDAMGRTTCPQGQVGRYRTRQPDLGFVDDCAVDVQPRAWQPNLPVTFTVEVSNFGMTASAPTTMDVMYEQSPQDPIPNLVTAGTINVPAVAAWSGGQPGRVAVSLNYTVPGTLAAGLYPVRLVIAPASGEAVTANNTIDIVAPPRGNVLSGAGAGSTQPPVARMFDGDGVLKQTFTAYAATGYGVDVAAGDINGLPPGRDEAITGPGPGAVYGPQVRAFNPDTTPISKVNYFAYGTLKYGVRVATGDVDGDGVDEIMTGAGQGAVFGPHVRGWNFDGGTLTTIAKISFFAYSTLKYGAEVAGGEYDADGFHELCTAPGPGQVFAQHLRGFNYDNASLTAIAKINFIPSSARYGGTVAWSDMEGDGWDELIAGLGPNAANPATVSLFNLDGGTPTLITTLTPFTSMYGANVGPAERDGLPWGELLTSPGPDPSANADVKSYRTILRSYSALPNVLSFPAATAPFGANVWGGAFGY